MPPSGFEPATHQQVSGRAATETVGKTKVLGEKYVPVPPCKDMRRLTTGIRSEKRVVRRFRRCANVIEQCFSTTGPRGPGINYTAP